MSDTPLSDLVSRVAAEGPAAFAAFFAAFLASNVGVIATALPTDRRPGELFQAAVGELELALVVTPDGRTMLKACADPAAFSQLHPDPPLSALMQGRQLVATLMASAQADGILVYSATSADSVPIARGDVPKLSLAAAPKGGWHWGG
jgi:hypothetical protein